MRAWLTLFLVVAAAVTVPAQKAPVRQIQFTVTLEPEALVLRPEVLENQAVITHVSVRPASGEPVFYPDMPGLPRLPRIARFVAVPPGAKVQSVTVAAAKMTTIDNVPMVGWASLAQPGQISDNPNDPKNRFAFPPQFPLDDKKREVYYPAAPHPPDPGVLKLKVYPEALASHTGITPHGEIASLLRLDVAPVQWHIETGTLTFATELQLTVTIDGNARFPKPKTAGDADTLDDLRFIVVNPGDLPFFFYEPRPVDVPYLIITDDNYWTPDFERTPGANLVEQFERLARWKTEKGVRATVVRISDIVDGRYGDFRTGAADLQETIRNFLKDTEARYHTRWVLLGGDIEIVPARKVAAWAWANADHLLMVEDNERPTPGRAYWDAARGSVILNTPATGFTHVISASSGQSFTEVAMPGAATPGWHVIGDAKCDMINARAGSRCIELVVPAGQVEDLAAVLVLPDNMIPTDLYYASLRGPEYNVPGRRDWDANGDGLYGTNVWSGSADGVSYVPTVRLGRAPVGNSEDARWFVSKVLLYEKYTGLPVGFTRRLLLGADNWGGGPGARPNVNDPPNEGEFFHAVGSAFTIAHFASAPAPASDWRIVSWSRSDAWMELGYTRDAAPGIDGFYFCTDVTCATRSEIFWPGIGGFGMVEIPIPTKFVKIFAPAGALRPALFFFDHRSQDGSMVEKEMVKDLFAARFPGFNDRKRLYKDIYDIAPAPDLSELFPVRLGEALLSGYNITSLSGHGWYGGCCGLEAGYIPDLLSFTSGIVYADSCLTNEFDQAAGDAVSELMLVQPGGGAVAYVGNTRYSWIGLGSAFERAFWARMRTTRHIGALHNTKSLFVSYPSEHWVNFSLNLMGDPETEIWRGRAEQMLVTVPNRVMQGDRITGRVLSLGAGMPLARVTLTGPGVYQDEITDGAGNFEFTPAGRPGDVLRVTATHTILEKVPDARNVQVIHRVFTLEPPPLPGPRDPPRRP